MVTMYRCKACGKKFQAGEEFAPGSGKCPVCSGPVAILGGQKKVAKAEPLGHPSPVAGASKSRPVTPITTRPAKTEAAGEPDLSQIIAQVGKAKSKPQAVPAWTPAKKQPRNRRLWLIVGASAGAVALALLGGLAFFLWTNEGTLALEIEPKDVRVEIDGSEVHVNTPRDDIRLPVGDHDLSVKKEGFDSFAKSFQISRNEKTEISVHPEKKWLVDFDEAQKKARDDKHDIFIYFDVSDSGGDFEKMREDILQPGFLEKIKKNYVLLYIDAPNNPKPEGDDPHHMWDRSNRNLDLRRKLLVERVPTVMLLDPSPVVILNEKYDHVFGRQEGYIKGGVEAFSTLFTRWRDADPDLQKAIAAEDTERARVLMQGQGVDRLYDSWLKRGMITLLPGNMLPVTVNGKPVGYMIWDSGASIVQLSWQAAELAGLKPKDTDPLITLTVANGDKVPARVVRAPTVSIGNYVKTFTAENVPCAVVIPNPKLPSVPLLLGMTFQKNFDCDFNPATRTVTIRGLVRRD